MVIIQEFSAVDGLGVLGFLTYATAELLLAFRKIHSDQVFFYVIYGLGAALILSSLMWEFNMGAFMTEMFSLLICALAIVVRLRAQHMGQRAGQDHPPYGGPNGPGYAAFFAHGPQTGAPVLQPPTR